MSNIDLWCQYTKTRDKNIKDQLIVEHIDLVKNIAGRLYNNYGKNVEYEDLVSYGIFGLLDAIDKYDPLKNVKFETYAYIRIRGAIIDQLRSLDWIPRSIRQKHKNIEKAYIALENKLGRNPEDGEVAEYLKISLGELNDIFAEISSLSIVSLEEKIMSNANFSIVSDDIDYNPEECIQREEVKNSLIKGLDALSEREQKIIRLYYYSELTYKEISNILNISESRISQIHTKAIMKLKSKLSDI
ncbi:FliA/WhiG family RNA polymerase sigma factor [Lutibacter sp. B2]|nr:FliA/WhiG family RNA polymerase sigma factor [Lutibacter sp. B2]